MKKAKKALALVLVFALTIAGTIGATIAYLQDTDNAKNTFTVGNVDIVLNEDERKPDGTVEEFIDDKILLPIVGSAQGEKEEVTTPEGVTTKVPTAANWQDKIVTVTNKNLSQDAWIRVVFAFPADMDDAQSAAEMMLHWNHNGEEAVAWDRVDNGATVTLDGKVYNLYTYTYTEVVAPGATTESAAITGVYVDSRVDADVTYKTITVDGKETEVIDTITYSFVNGRGETKTATFTADEEGNVVGPQIYVVAQAVQAAGFDTYEAAFDATFGDATTEKADEWFKNVE
ncbi:MAG: hypothetical protein IJ410_01515 [Oscillospiraceae bacterium]|nr:hypothetical protein [Oscillospiraceae bacterium]